jgi:hypothetical protein
MSEARLLLEPWQQEGDELIVAASLDDPQGQRHRLWWRLPALWRAALTSWADPFVVALLIPRMQWLRDVHVEGRVSPSLLANLERCMALVQVWSEGRYPPVTIRGAEEVECPPPLAPGKVHALAQSHSPAVPGLAVEPPRAGTTGAPAADARRPALSGS